MLEPARVPQTRGTRMDPYLHTRESHTRNCGSDPIWERGRVI